jgi:NAD(P)-dependent dehydrogenase (short-subunit alcohol dehydrogenase family)
MQVDLAGKSYRCIGPGGSVGDAVADALGANGAVPTEGRPDLLIVVQTLLPEATANDPLALLRTVTSEARAMAAAGGGRVVFVLSALAGLPMRRHPEYSAAMASAAAGMRGLAMELGPKVLVNAVGAGCIESNGGALLAGDRGMLTHAALGRAGVPADLTNAVLFLCDPANSYTTGQLLNVDGGWSVGYGRNF